MAELAERQGARLHDVESVMARLNIGRSKTFELFGDGTGGTLRSVKVGRRRLVSEAALVEFIERLDAEAKGMSPEPREPTGPDWSMGGTA